MRKTTVAARIGFHLPDVHHRDDDSSDRKQTISNSYKPRNWQDWVSSGRLSYETTISTRSHGRCPTQQCDRFGAASIEYSHLWSEAIQSIPLYLPRHLWPTASTITPFIASKTANYSDNRFESCTYTSDIISLCGHPQIFFQRHMASG